MLWLQERAWRRQAQRERDWWRERLVTERTLADRSMELNWELAAKLQRATSARKDVN